MKQDSGFRIQETGVRVQGSVSRGHRSPVTDHRLPITGSRRGFTLVEMLVVVLIMALLMGILVRTLGGAGEQSDKAATQAKIERVKAALEEFYAEYGQYPPVPFYEGVQPVSFEYPTSYSGINAKWSGTPFLGTYDEKTDDPEKRLFTFGLVSFLLPRYETIRKVKYFADNKTALNDHKQWTPYTPAQNDLDRDLNAYQRWKPFLEGVIDGSEFFRGGTSEDPHHINIGQTIVDAWNQELRYESLPPHQSYKIWSIGRNEKDEGGHGDDIGVFMNK